MRGLYLVATAALAAALACAVHGETKRREFNSSSARNAKARYAAKVEKLEKEFQAKVSGARKEYIADLEKAQADSKRLADLDEAVLIRDTLEEQKKDEVAAKATGHIRESDPSAGLREKIAGSVWNLPGNGKIGFQPDGSVVRDQWAGRWAAVSDRVVLVRYADHEVVDAFTFDEKVTRYSALGAALTNAFQGTRAQ